MHRISHHVTQLAVPFPCDACGHGDRRDAARLRHHDARRNSVGGVVGPVVQQELRQLSRFASGNPNEETRNSERMPDKNDTPLKSKTKQINGF